MNKFESFLAQQLEQYVTYRHNLGYAMKASLSHLKTFDRYLKQKQVEKVLLPPSFFIQLLPKFIWLFIIHQFLGANFL